MLTAWFPSGLRARLMLLVLGTLGVSTALMVYQAAQQRTDAIRAATGEAVLLSRLAAAHEERSVAVARQLLRGLAASEAVRRHDAEQTARLVDRLRERPGTIRGLVALTPDGDVFASLNPSERNANYSAARWFRRALASGEFTVGELTGGGADASLRCALPVYDGPARLVAVVGAELDADWLRRSAARVRLPEHTTFLVADRGGAVIARHPPLDPADRDSVVALPAGAETEWLQVVRGGDGRAHLVAFEPLQAGRGVSMYVGVSIDEEAVVADATRAFWRSLSMLLLVGVLVSAVAWFGVQAAVIRRVEALLAATDRLRAGDLAARTGLRHGRGELSRLARAFDEMASELQQTNEVRARAEAQVRASEAHKTAVLESSLDGILVLDSSGRVTECNAAARRLFGCAGRPCVHHRLAQLFRELPLPGGGVSETQGRPVEAVAQRLDGTTFPVEIALAPIRDAAGWGLFVATFRDITERKRWERSLEALTFVDDLTGLYNRRGFSMFASQQMRLAARTGQQVVLVSVDLDGLKTINDTFGHHEGDRAILEMAVILRRSFRESDVIARFGGDEFVVLATEAEGTGAESSLERLAERIALRNRHGDLPWTLAASFGWTRIDPRSAPPLGDLLAIADARMYEAKRAGRASAEAPEAPRAFAVPASVSEFEHARRRDD